MHILADCEGCIMTVRDLIQELLLNSSLDDEVVIAYDFKDDYMFQNATMIVKYEEQGQVGIVGKCD